MAPYRHMPALGNEGAIGKRTFLFAPMDVDVVTIWDIPVIVKAKHKDAFNKHVARGVDAYVQAQGFLEDIPPRANEECSTMAFIRYPVSGNLIWPVSANRAVDGIFEEDWNWTYKEENETSGLLEDFLELAKPAVAEHAIIQKVKRFVTRWGPLWECIAHSDCRCSDVLSDTGDDCLWFPFEIVSNFQVEARKAENVLTMAAYLRRGEAAPLRPLLDLMRYSTKLKAITEIGLKRILENRLEGITEEQMIIGMQRHFILTTIRNRLRINGPLVDFDWPEDGQPRIRINTGLGFLRIVWLQIAQRISGGRYACICANPSCGKYFFRKEKPRSGEDVFCDSDQCKPARKALYMQRVRAGEPKRRKPRTS